MAEPAARRDGAAALPGLCRDCGRPVAAGDPRCPACRSPRVIRHAELLQLSIAHIDCDAFYASVEKRDNPDLADQPVIVGGGRRGVVSACCYVARLYGVGSAMPMFKALKACPHAVVIRPNMEKYSAVGRQVRELMQEMTPLVEPLSIDEAFLDLSGTERLHGRPPAATLIHLVNRIERELGVTASIGLAPNKFLAKLASDRDKPRGFSIIGAAEAEAVLAALPVGAVYGIGKATAARLKRDGLTHLSQIQKASKDHLIRRYGSLGERLKSLAHGIDRRKVDPGGEIKSISSETTFESDLDSLAALSAKLWPLCEKVARRLRRQGLAGRTLTLKLKTNRFRTISRARQLSSPTQLAERIYKAALPLLEKEATGAAYRLIGVGLKDFSPEAMADPPDLAEPGIRRQRDVENVMESLREKLGRDAVVKGRGFTGTREGR